MDSFKRVVANMMARFGFSTQVIIRSDSGTYDSSTSEYVTGETVYVVKAIVMDLTLQSNGAQSEKNTLIQAGDKQVFIQPLSADFPLPKLKPNRDVIKLGDEVWKIVTLKEVNPTYGDAILLELYARK